MLGLALVITRLYTAQDIYRRQMLLLLLACAIPVGANIVYVFSFGPVPGLDLTPMMFTLSGLIVAFGIVRYQLFSIMPVTYSRVFRTITDGVIVTDNMGRIVDVNPAAETILQSSAGSLIACQLQDILPATARLITIGENTPVISHDEITLERNGSAEYFDTLCVPLDPDAAEDTGHLLILRDITRRKKAEIALEEANKKLNLMASITRHDILNQITALNCYIELNATEATTPEQKGYLEKEKKIIDVIQAQIGFTREYQNLGVELPQWQDVRSVIARVIPQVDPGTAQIIVQVPACEIYADPMFEKVFNNLMSNAILYGKTLTRITITGKQDGRDFLITCEDDGVGISREDKDQLFTRGFGKQTGLGLFLSREILAITGLSIKENSEPDQGARFVIRVPGGSWRRPA
jgi:PAS domain S-box-containing protein